MAEENNNYSFGQLGVDLFNVAGGQYIAGKAGESAAELGGRALTESSQLAEEVGEMAQFQPFTVTTGLGKTTTDATGGYDLQMSPEQQALQNQLLGQSQALFGQVGVDPRTAQNALYEQIRATQRPEEERQRLALEERMLSQGRMGLSSSAYGGASPELLAQETARQEAMARASLGARTQAMAEQQQALQLGTGLMTQGYIPQQQALASLGYGVDLAKLPQYGRQSAAEFYGKAGMAGLESLMQGLGSQAAYETAGQQGLFNTLGGILSSVLTPSAPAEGEASPTLSEQLQDINTALEEYNLENLDDLLPTIDYTPSPPRDGEVIVEEIV